MQQIKAGKSRPDDDDVQNRALLICHLSSKRLCELIRNTLVDSISLLDITISILYSNALMFQLTDQQNAEFHRDGFVVVDGLIDDHTIDQLREAFERIFSGRFETGIRPDEVNWQAGESDPAKTRQICNAWKGDLTNARTALREDIGRASAALGQWPGARLQGDNALWKPPGAGSIGMHQDCTYLSWLNPCEMISCWIALDDTTADGGTMQLARGSHRWKPTEELGEFHDPPDHQALMRAAAARDGIDDPEIVPVVV